MITPFPSLLTPLPFPFFSFPLTRRQLCIHPVLNLPIIAEVAAKQLCVGIEGYPLRVPVPEGYFFILSFLPENQIP